MKHVTVKQGNTGPIITATAGPAAEYPTGWIGRIVVASTYGMDTPEIDQAFTPAAGVMRCWLTHSQTASLAPGKYFVAVEMTNASTTPEYHLEEVILLTITKQVAT